MDQAAVRGNVPFLAVFCFVFNFQPLYSVHELFDNPGPDLTPCEETRWTHEYSQRLTLTFHFSQNKTHILLWQSSDENHIKLWLIFTLSKGAMDGEAITEMTAQSRAVVSALLHGKSCSATITALSAVYSWYEVYLRVTQPHHADIQRLCHYCGKCCTDTPHFTETGTL